MNVRERVAACIDKNVEAATTVTLGAAALFFATLALLLYPVGWVWWVISLGLGCYYACTAIVYGIIVHRTRDFTGDRLRDEGWS